MSSSSALCILEPMTMRGLTARNRLWLPPMCMYSVEAQDGVVTDWHVTHYASRAVGGFGTVIVEATAVTPEGRLSPNDLGLWSDEQVAGQRRLVEAIHAGGALAGIQIGHGGRKSGTPPWRPKVEGARTGTLEGWELLAPSAIPFPQHAVPTELDEAGISRLVEAFAAAARRRRRGRVRRRRDPRGPRLPHPRVPLRPVQPAHRLLRRKRGEPAALPAGGGAGRARGRRAGHGSRHPTVGLGLGRRWRDR